VFNDLNARWAGWPIADHRSINGRWVRVDDLDPHAWFQRDELETCSLCGEHAAIRLPTSGSLLCLVCGGVTVAPEVPTDEPRTTQ
jgi:hypothetical protein